jgi:hypothetical protein
LVFCTGNQVLSIYSIVTLVHSHNPWLPSCFVISHAGNFTLSLVLKVTHLITAFPNYIHLLSNKHLLSSYIYYVLCPYTNCWGGLIHKLLSQGIDVHIVETISLWFCMVAKLTMNKCYHTYFIVVYICLRSHN